MHLNSAALALGLLAFGGAPQAQATINLVSNGNFEIGSLAGWTLDAGSTFVTLLDDSFVAALGTTSTGNTFQISQLVYAGPTAHGFTVSFDWAPMPATTPQSLQLAVADWQGTVFSALVTAPASTSQQTLLHYQFSFLYFGASTLQFALQNASDTPSAGQYLDNVVVSVPEPSAAALLMLGALALAVRRCRRHD